MCPIIFGRSFLNTIGAKIDFRQETVSLEFGEEEMKVNFSEFKDNPDRGEFKEQEEAEENVDLTSIHLVTQLDKQEEVIEETSFEKEGESLDLTLHEDLMLKEPYEEPKRKGDEELPPPELKPLPKELKYRFPDDTNKSERWVSKIVSKDLGSDQR
jgi:hypothetical protein